MRTRSLLLATSLVAMSTLACSSSDDPSDSNEPGENEPIPGDPDGPVDDPSLDGIQPCPEDTSQQGPEPCVDEAGAVLCRVNSGYPGDELAICEPDPSEGLLLHYGPNDYDDPEQIELFLLEAGGEDENCTFVVTPNTEDAFITNYHGRMRPNSHHLILMTLDAPTEPTDVPGACDVGELIGARWLVGSQDPVIDIAAGGSLTGQGVDPQPGDPDYGLAQSIAPNVPIRIDSHYTNPTTETILREAWVYFDYTDPNDVEDLVDMITFFQLAIDVQPQSSFITERKRCEAGTDRYVGMLTAHFHELGTRFSVWKEDLAGNETLVYETYDWAEPGNLFFRDGMSVPAPNADTNTYGGDHEGYLQLAAGEALSFECEFFNFHDRRVTIGVTAKDEMCNVFGMYYPTDGNVWSCR